MSDQSLGTLALTCKQPLAYMAIGLLGQADGCSSLRLSCSVEDLALIKTNSTPCRLGWVGVGAGLVSVQAAVVLWPVWFNASLLGPLGFASDVKPGLSHPGAFATNFTPDTLDCFRELCKQQGSQYS